MLHPSQMMDRGLLPDILVFRTVSGNKMQFIFLYLCSQIQSIELLKRNLHPINDVLSKRPSAETRGSSMPFQDLSQGSGFGMINHHDTF